MEGQPTQVPPVGQKKLSKCWLLIMHNPKFMKSYCWKTLLDNINMQTEGLAFYMDEMTEESGAFCIFRTPRTLDKMQEKIGEHCKIERLPLKFSTCHEKYLRLKERNILQIVGSEKVRIKLCKWCLFAVEMYLH